MGSTPQLHSILTHSLRGTTLTKIHPKPAITLPLLATSSRPRPASPQHHLRHQAKAAPSLRISARWGRQSRPAPLSQPLAAIRPSWLRSRSSAYYEKPITHPISLYLSTTPLTNHDHHTLYRRYKTESNSSHFFKHFSYETDWPPALSCSGSPRVLILLQVIWIQTSKMILDPVRAAHLWK